MREQADTNPTDEDLVYPGPCGDIRFARVTEGDRPAKGFWDSLSKSEQGKFQALFGHITNNPQLQLHNKDKFKQVEGVKGLWEFKRNDLQMRLFCFRKKNSLYLVYGIRGKKENKIEPGEVNRAERFMDESKARFKEQE